MIFPNIKVIPLPYHGQVASLFKPESSLKEGKLTLFQADSSDDGFYVPAQSFTLWSDAALLAIRDALNAAYPNDKYPAEAA